MGTCVTCGNNYDKSFTITMPDGRDYEFDSFECAIEAVAPTCENCGVRIIGHGFEVNGTMYCSDHCARQEGITEFEDRVD